MLRHRLWNLIMYKNKYNNIYKTLRAVSASIVIVNLGYKTVIKIN
jgi:hypothetical protein